MKTNPELSLALNFINKTDRNLFITGKAGTGKTTFLHQIKEESLKRMIVVAPTGVAAINAKGVTIHSFFQMPFGPILPGQNTANQQRKFSKTKIDIIKSLDLVVIDEVSMVRADLLDGIDQVLRRYKNRNLAFGGAQVLMIGDLQQLAPVVKPNEWDLLKNHYDTVYFFSSKAFQEANVVSIELKHIYRQKNEDFIKVLNEIRSDRISEASLNLLNERYDPNFKAEQNSGYITLTTHNKRAQTINEQRLDELESKTVYFEASVEGKFNESSFPNDERLALKVGAQVMFIKNDSSPEKRYYNGKIGVITALKKETVTVQCPNEVEEIVTEREVWDNVNYSINEDTNELKEEVIGRFAQIPLRLAWAITIHKSQGLTFDKAIIDAEASFAHGQTYVALSRCTSLEGLVLTSRISNQAIINDTTVASFTEDVEKNPPSEKELTDSEIQFQLNLISELFDYQALLPPIVRMIDLYYKNQTVIKGAVIEHLKNSKEKGVVPLLKVATAFKSQLKRLAEDRVLPERSSIIQQRFTKGVNYFLGETKSKIENPIESISFSTDNKGLKKDFTKAFDTLQEKLSEKRFILEKMKEGFQVQTYLQVRADAVLQEKSPKKKKTLSRKTDPILALKLRELRSDIAESLQIPPFQIFTQETLYQLCDDLPRTEKELLKVKGMGKVRVSKYGDEILEIIETYCKENGINTFKEQKKEAKKSTKQISLELFTSGMSVKEIAKARKLTENTIQNHLMSFIPSGDVDVLELIPLKRYKKVRDAIEGVNFKSLTELKEKVDANFSYVELKMVLLSMED